LFSKSFSIRISIILIYVDKTVLVPKNKKKEFGPKNG